MTQMPAGWYPADNGHWRYWSGAEWTDQNGPTAPPTSPYSSTATQLTPQPAKKKRRIFLWVFLAIQVLFIAWIIAGLILTRDATDCSGLDQATCEATANPDARAGLFFLFVYWMMGDILLAVGYGIYRSFKPQFPAF